MAHSPLDTQEHDGPRLRDHHQVFRWIARTDDGYYALERVCVTVAMLVMSVVVCLNIFYSFIIRQTMNLSAMQAGGGSITRLSEGILFIAFVGLVGRASVTAGTARRPSATIQLAGALAAAGGITLLAFSMLRLDSATVCRILLVLTTVLLIIEEFKRPVPIAGPALPTLSLLRILGVCVLAAVGYSVCGNIPTGYSWAQKLALFLLLWVAFIGASMATHDRRHLTIDAARKAVPDRFLPFYNAISYLVAAIFTAGFFYLSYLYWGLRYAETPTPGEIPDWIKVLSIPFSLALVTLRFFGHAAAEAITGALGLHTRSAPADGTT